MNEQTIHYPRKLRSALEPFSKQGLITADQLQDLPTGKGAYLLVLAIEDPFELAIKTLADTRINPGLYIYCGSARGPGGIKARLKRHFSRDKRKHWHIDHLSLQAARLEALAVFDGDECVLTSSLLSSPHISIPVKGFGASDCTSCQSHLLRWSE